MFSITTLGKIRDDKDVDVMADMFLDMTKKAFDLCAPEKNQST